MDPKWASTWVELPKSIHPYFLNRNREFPRSFHQCLNYIRHQSFIKTNDTSLNLHQRFLIQTLGSFSADLLDVSPAPPTQSDALVRFHPHTNADTYSMALMILHKSPTPNHKICWYCGMSEHLRPLCPQREHLWGNVPSNVKASV